jgi:hypothetical protein
VPHALQNLAPRLLSAWHWGQLDLLSADGAITALGGAAFKSCPQPLQNLALSLFSVAHFGHVTAIFFP